MRSEGSRLLGAVEMTQAEIAVRVGVRQPTIAAWISGQHAPKPKYRKILRVAFGIPLEAWPADVEVEELRAKVRSLSDEVAAVRRGAVLIATVVIEEAKGSPEVLARIADRVSDMVRR
jgi:transcriptional regulator with XRE-family HTH domain